MARADYAPTRAVTPPAACQEPRRTRLRPRSPRRGPTVNLDASSEGGGSIALIDLRQPKVWLAGGVRR